MYRKTVKTFLFGSIAGSWLVLAGSVAGQKQAAPALPLVSADFVANKGGEIIWDEYGIPHIYGPDLLTAVKGFGFAQMESHAEMILQKTAEARGRTAEYFGPGTRNANVEHDIRIRTYGIPQRAAQWYQAGGSFQRLILQAFVFGMNEYAEKFSQSIDPRFRQMLPLTPQDVLGMEQYTVHFTFLPETSGLPDELAAWQKNPNAKSIKPAPPATRIGSNAWALAPSRTTDGNAILMGNPHLPWGVNQPVPGLDVYQWVEANLVIGDPKQPWLNASGVTFPGSPFIGIGFNDYMGWTHTVNSIKNADLYELTLVNGGYLFDGAVRAFDQRTDEIKIRQPDGSYTTQTFTVLNSVQGPVVAQQGNKSLALRVAGLDSPAMIKQYWEMMLSRHLSEFALANSQLQMPFFNVIYADRYGQIMYLFGGRQPVRPGGTYEDWAGILPGDTSSALWTQTLDWWQLPKTIDPPGGYVSNSNEPPWFATFPQMILQGDYPAYIAPDSTFFRPQAGALFLQSKSRFTTDEVLTGKESTHMLFADRVLPDLLSAARVSADPSARAAADVLERWSRNSDASDTGALLFEKWYETYLADPSSPRSVTWGPEYPAFRTEWSDAKPLTTPIGLADPARSVGYLIAAAKQIETQFGRLDMPFGDVNRIVLVDHDKTFENVTGLTNSPASGSGDPFGGIRALYFVPAPVANQNLAINGDTYAQLVKFTKNGAQAQALLSYGNASRPGSPHIADQLPLFQAKQLRAVYRTRNEVEAHAAKRENY
ncbi:MAG: penicillin acylase family protein [Verrucomicrobia bacterium]|nr:penicillin acylase family protein [Verrucomicrobiota bacterium]